MAAIGQVDAAAAAGLRGVAQGGGVAGLAQNDQDELNRAANERADAARPAVGEGQTGAGAQVEVAANVNQANAAVQNDDGADEQSELRENIASQDQQLPTPADPSRGTQLDIAV